MLKQSGEGHVVNTASLAGLLSGPYHAIYYATKHAVVTITESLHHELSLLDCEIKASVLLPGFTRTNIMESYRNRAAEFGTQSADEATTVPSMLAAYRQAVEAGFPPQFVAEQVFHAIWHENLYIHTTTEFHELVRQRIEGIVRKKILSSLRSACARAGSRLPGVRRTARPLFSMHQFVILFSAS